MRKTNIATILFACLAPLFYAGCMEAEAKPPNRIREWEHYTRVPAPNRGRNHTTGTTDAVVTIDGTNNWCFEFGTAINIMCSGEVDFCFSQATEATISEGATAGTITDPAGDATLGNNVGPASGIGPCFRAPAASIIDVLLLDVWTEAVAGFRGGYCTGTTANDRPFWPCDANADCGAGGTCNTPSGTNRAVNGCAFLISDAAASAECFVREDR